MSEPMFLTLTARRLARPTLPASTASRPASVTIASRPSRGTGRLGIYY
jgi:hypothetical protein